jgi:hypothetical protein
VLFLAGLVVVAGLAVRTAHELHNFLQKEPYRYQLGDLAGFVDKESYEPGETIRLFVHTSIPASAHLIRYAETNNATRVRFDIPATLQSDLYNPAVGFQWHESAEIKTADLAPGFYGLELVQNDDSKSRFVVPLIIKPKKTTGIAVVLSTNTWAAYNDFGGISNYRNQSMSWLTWRFLKAHAELAGKGNFYLTYLPRNRPNSLISEDLIGHVDYRHDYHSRFARNEWSMIGFLEKHRIPYGVYADRDLESNDSLLASHLIIFPGHSEYWSAEMFNSFDKFVGTGGKVFMASGKPMAELVEWRKDLLVVLAQNMTPQEVASRVGTNFTMAGAYTAAPFRVDNSESWILNGTGLKFGDIFGEDSSNHARADFAISAQKSGASGLFTGIMGPGSASFVRISRGLNQLGPADMVIQERASGGWVFNASSETFVGSATRDKNVAQIILNLVRQGLTESNPASSNHLNKVK